MVNMLRDSDPPADQDWLRCLHCDYNLTGLTESRCPECGQPFDPEYLRALGSATPQPVHPWDDRAQIGLWRAFGRTCWATWIHPAEFARHLPVQDSTSSAFAFSVACYGVVVAVVLMTAPVLFLDAPEIMIVFALGCSTTIPFSAFLCEVFLAVLLAALIRPTRGRKQDSYRFWRALNHFTSNYLLLSVTGVMACGVLWKTIDARVSRAEWGPESFSVLIVLLPGTSILWWWRALAAFILERGQGSWSRRAVAIIAIPLIAAMAAIVAGAVSAFLLAPTLVGLP